jgi:2-keto-4-pentenoate hydratase/2-oxohepta-3-ene-1,7-dioic acid hydratase in catechol pathway
VTTYIRYLFNSAPSYGILDNGRITALEGDLFHHRPTGATHALADVRLLTPCTPPQVIAVGRNYESHLLQAVKLPEPTRPEIFFKPVSCLQDPDGPIVVPPDSTDLHYEGELVLVIGKRLRHASKEEARAAIFGATCGNDLSERNWQKGPDKDVQWWRAKGSDTFGPLGPVIVTGLDYDNLRLQTRLNGEVVQDQRTSDFIFDCATQVSFISRYMTIQQGDVIYTGTPGQTRPMKPGDVVEVEIEGIGVLRNPVVAG